MAFRTLDSVILEHAYEPAALRAELEDFTYAEFKEMQAQWLTSGRQLWYVHGNISTEAAKTIVGQAVTTLGLKSVAKESLGEVRHVDLSSDKAHFQRVDQTVQDPTNENSCLLTYYQYGYGDAEGKDGLLNKVVMQYLDEPTFDQLRTKEQLGYVVFSRPRDSRSVLGAWFLVQSPGKDCLHLRQRLQVHLAKMRKRVQAMTEEEF